MHIEMCSVMISLEAYVLILLARMQLSVTPPLPRRAI